MTNNFCISAIVVLIALSIFIGAILLLVYGYKPWYVRVRELERRLRPALDPLPEQYSIAVVANSLDRCIAMRNLLKSEGVWAPIDLVDLTTLDRTNLKCMRRLCVVYDSDIDATQKAHVEVPMELSLKSMLEAAFNKGLIPTRDFQELCIWCSDDELNYGAVA